MPGEPAVTQLGDVWTCDDHRLICGDAMIEATYSAVMMDEKAEIVFTDPPYNVPNAGHVTGRDGVRELKWPMARCLLASSRNFLAVVCKHVRTQMVDGAVAYICMDWRHLLETAWRG